MPIPVPPSPFLHLPNTPDRQNGHLEGSPIIPWERKKDFYAYLFDGAGRGREGEAEDFCVTWTNVVFVNKNMNISLSLFLVGVSSSWGHARLPFFRAHAAHLSIWRKRDGDDDLARMYTTQIIIVAIWGSRVTAQDGFPIMAGGGRCRQGDKRPVGFTVVILPSLSGEITIIPRRWKMWRIITFLGRTEFLITCFWWDMASDVFFF